MKAMAPRTMGSGQRALLAVGLVLATALVAPASVSGASQTCTDEYGCGDYQDCYNGVCLSYLMGACSTDADCAPGHACDTATCKKASFQPCSTGECHSALTCAKPTPASSEELCLGNTNAACKSSGDCASNLACVSSLCKALKAAGDSCASDDECGVVASTSTKLRCLGAAGSMACKAPPTEKCDADAQCPVGFLCGSPRGSGWPQQCLGSTGTACNSDGDCLSNLGCAMDAAAAKKVCKALKAAGDSCTYDEECGVVASTNTKLRCLGAAGSMKCKAPPTEKCDADAQCPTGFLCGSPRGSGWPQQCLGSTGTACNSDGDCLSNLGCAMESAKKVCKALKVADTACTYDEECGVVAGTNTKLRCLGATGSKKCKAPLTEKCDADAQCPTGFLCGSPRGSGWPQQCLGSTGTACNSDGDCLSNLGCAMDVTAAKKVCKALKVADASCTYDEECGVVASTNNKLRCLGVTGSKKCKVLPTEKCDSNNQCPTGFQCGSPRGSGSPNQCLGSPSTACNSDGDCLSNLACVGSTATNKVCQALKTVGQSCAGDHECGTRTLADGTTKITLHCISGACKIRPTEQCRFSTDCPANYDCANPRWTSLFTKNQCLGDTGAPCTSKGDCTFPLECIANQCQAGKAVSASCSNDEECGVKVLSLLPLVFTDLKCVADINTPAGAKSCKIPMHQICISNSDCQSGLTCTLPRDAAAGARKQCLAATASACDTHGQCAPGLFCVSGTCQALKTVGTACSSDDQCGSLISNNNAISVLKCTGGKCKAPKFHLCFDSSHCADAANPSTAMICSTPRTPTDETRSMCLVDGTGACTTDGDCGPKLVCRGAEGSKTCQGDQGYTTCSSTKPCASPFVCSSGKCVRRLSKGKTCSVAGVPVPDTECNPGTTCGANGKCQQVAV